jgi:TonB family protein
MRIRKALIMVMTLAGTCLLASTMFGNQNRQVKKMVQPVYPPTALQMRVEGTVKLEAVVDRDGNVEKVIVVSGHTLLKGSAVECVKQWKYEPAGDLSLVPIQVVFRLPE